MLATVLELSDLFGKLGVNSARVAKLQEVAAEFDEEVTAGAVYNVTAGAVKDSLSNLQRMFDKAHVTVGYQSPDAHALGELYHELPYSIDGATVKKAVRNIEAALLNQNISNELRESLNLELRVARVYATAVGELKAVKGNLIKGRKNIKLKPITDFTTPIAVAVAPLREAAMKDAEERARHRTAHIKTAFEEANWDLNIVAPEPPDMPRTFASESEREEFVLMRRAAFDKRQFYRQFVTRNEEINNPAYEEQKVFIVEWREEAVEEFVNKTREIAADLYEVYVYKLNLKVGAHTAAELEKESNFIWSNSTLRVTKADGTVERWNTKVIVNVSSLGKYFNQWPTRLIKN